METEKNTENVWKAEQKNKENVENQAYQISQERALEMLEELLEQDQFELLLPEYKLVYILEIGNGNRFYLCIVDRAYRSKSQLHTT